MFSEAELLKAINELEKTSTTYQDAEKLATFYILYDHLYKKREIKYETVREVTIDRYNDSEFSCAIKEKKANDVWSIVSEAIEVLKIIEPGVYVATIKRLNELKIPHR